MDPHQLRTVRLGDDPEAWTAAGFTVDRRPPAARVLLGRTTLVLNGRGSGVEGWSLAGVDEEVDGIPTVPSAPPPPDDPHPNGVFRLDHVVVTTGDRRRTVDAFESAGLTVRGERRGTAFGSAVHQTFLWAGDVIVEVVSPADSSDDRPAEIFGLAVVTSDLARTADLLGERLGRPRAAVQPGRQVAPMRADGIGVPVLVMSPHVRPDPHDPA